MYFSGISEIKAQGKYRGISPVPVYLFFGNMDYSNAEPKDPNQGGLLSYPNPYPVSSNMAKPQTGLTLSGNDPALEAYSRVFDFIKTKELDGAIDQFKWIIDQAPDTELAENAICQLYQCYRRKGNTDDAEKFFANVDNGSKSDNLKLLAKYFQAGYLAQKGQRNAALAHYLQAAWPMG